MDSVDNSVNNLLSVKKAVEKNILTNRFMQTMSMGPGFPAASSEIHEKASNCNKSSAMRDE